MNARCSALALTLVAALLALSACGGVSSASEPPIAVTDAWSWPALAGSGNGVVYMTVRNNTDTPDTILGAQSDVADSVELHTSTQDANGVVAMRPVASIALPARGAVQLATGGAHVMLIGLHKDLRPGDTIAIRLRLEHAGQIDVTANVRGS